MSTATARAAPTVGPVLEACPMAEAVIAAIRELNLGVVVQDRGAYLRVLTPGRCVLSRTVLEGLLGREFRLPADLEPLMPSFKGSLQVTDDFAVWRSEPR